MKTGVDIAGETSGIVFKYDNYNELEQATSGLHGLGIDGAAGQTHGVGQILGIVVTLGGREVEAAAMAADAGTDILDALFNELGNPCGVCRN